MFNTLRNYSKIIIIIVVVAMVITGGLMGYGSLNKSSVANAPSSYIAKVNDTHITQQEFYYLLQQQASQAAQLSNMQFVPFKLNVLNALIERELILQRAEEIGINPEINDKDVDDSINKVLEANKMTLDELKNNLTEQGYSIDKYKQDIKSNMEINEKIKQTVETSYSNIKVTDDEIAREYEKVHPLVISKNFNDDKEGAQKEIEEALVKLNEGVIFSEVAKEYSDLKMNDGDLGFIGYDNWLLSKDIVEEIFSLEKGETSNIITGEDAFYIIKVMDKRLAEGKDFADAQEEIKKNLLAQKQNNTFMNWLENLKGGAKIEIYDSSLNGYEALRKGNFKLAIDEFERTLEIAPNPSIYVYLAQAYKENKETTKGLETFARALEEYPDDWELHLSYGTFLAEQDKEKAIFQYDEASKLAGEDFMAHYQLYMAYTQLEAKEKATAEMEILKDIQQKMQEMNSAEEDSQNNSEENHNTTNE